MAITINGSGTIGGVSVGGLPNGIVDTDMLASAAVEQAKIASGVVGNGPAFHVRASSTQAVSQSTWTKVTFDTEIFDTDNCYSSSTFTPTVAGYYYIAANLRFGFNAPWTGLGFSIRKNGSEVMPPIYLEQLNTANSGTSLHLTGGCTAYLNGSSDYLDIYANLTSGGGVVRELNYASTTACCHCYGFMIRAA